MENLTHRSPPSKLQLTSHTLALFESQITSTGTEDTQDFQHPPQSRAVSFQRTSTEQLFPTLATQQTQLECSDNANDLPCPTT